jgi:leucyl-tRNA synthetase
MSKSKYNVVTPDIFENMERYVAFVRNVLGPLEQAKPWNTAGISGVFGFLKNYGVCIMKKKLWWSLMRCQPKTT